MTEYKVYEMNAQSEKLQDKLNEFAPSGWELVALYPKPPHTILVLKRPSDEPQR